MTTSGTIDLDRVYYKVDVNLAFQRVLVVSTGNNTGDTIIITDLRTRHHLGCSRPTPVGPVSS